MRVLSSHAAVSALLVLPTVVLLLGCEDPFVSPPQALSAQGGIPGSVDEAADAKLADDESAKAHSQGHSLGPGHAKRLYYQFIDAGGRVRFVERLSDVPKRWQGRVGFVEMESAPPLSPAMAERTRERRYAAVADQYRRKLPSDRAMPTQIILYSADWCGWCQKAKAHLDRQGIRYQVRDIDHPQNLQELVAKTGQKGIPVLDVGGKVVTGFSPERYDQLIRSGRT